MIQTRKGLPSALTSAFIRIKNTTKEKNKTKNLIKKILFSRFKIY